MKMSEEMAVRLHRMMWSDMQKELGDNPSGKERAQFKYAWIHTHFPGESIANDCWLCEYASSKASRSDCDPYCKYCPIKWPNPHCNTLGFSYAKDSISEILALPAKNEKDVDKYVAYDEKMVLDAYYRYREFLLSKASGIPASSPIEDHVKSIQKKTVEDADAQKVSIFHALAESSELFKQYADEQKVPIFHALAEASGLSDGNESVKAHISKIKERSKNAGRFERSEEVFKQLSVHSGVTKDDWSVYDHAMAIKRNAASKKELDEAHEKIMEAVSELNLYQSVLSCESNLPKNAPIADHITQIREDAFCDGKEHERERIMNKIGEMLNDKSTGTRKDI